MSIIAEKRVSISPTRQMTMPIFLYKKFGFGDSAIFIDEGDRLVIKPEPKCSGEFDDEILADLIDEGYQNKELISEFKKRREKIPKAVEKIKEMSNNAAKGIGEFDTYDEVFN